MANIKQAKKRILVNAKKRLQNQSVRSAVRTALKKARTTVMEGVDVSLSEKLVGEAIKKIDKAASKGIMHKNTAARKKSRLMLKLNSQKSEAAK